MRRPAPLSEASMLNAEARIPELAAQAGRAAHQRALAETGRVVMKTAGGMLVERQASGQVVVIKRLPATTPTPTGTVLKRTKSPARKTGTVR
ncbi:hypothetical protein [Pelomonas sp. BJYL3]|uniref:hypothetical protein n=1 Tax=Pelomonas sp. BJYL3 TaxID=2976697 RepID=UPI0022B47D93|nr:hypothetical protein [Pelomonas sp. BJYL3]